MNSADRLWAVFWICLAAFLISVSGMIYASSVHPSRVQVDRVQAQARIIEQRVSQNERMACIAARGTWDATDNDGRAPYSCDFKR